MGQSQEKRQFERIPTNEPATLIFSDGRRIPGVTRDIGMGGYLFVPDHPDVLPNSGEACRIEVEIFYGRFTDLPCTVLHVGKDGIGVKIQRHYPAPDA
ncbi:MAG: PilZ domain-containing protein [Magnetococcales bacterium]|nr:PilZ domain-containing protein [Magnetococcales bacterium]MBF0321581.1 PilZ domain-containing protein [Magnetococcales bacterium]